MRKPLTLVKGSLLAFSVCTLFVSNAFAFEELGSAELEPSDEPALNAVGTKLVFARGAEEVTYTVTDVTDQHISYERNDGCGWKDPVKDFLFTPSEDWTNCSKSSGVAKVKTKGSMFPLKSGSKATYTVKGETTDGAWTGKWADKRKCKTKGAVRVKTVSGEYDTWKVVCKGNNDKRTRYFSPDLGVNVVSIRKHYKNPNKSWTNELIRVE